METEGKITCVGVGQAKQLCFANMESHSGHDRVLFPLFHLLLNLREQLLNLGGFAPPNHQLELQKHGLLFVQRMESIQALLGLDPIVLMERATEFYL